MMDSASPFPILNTLPNTHLPHEDFAAHAALEARLRATVRGEVRFDPASRALYATDASNYRQVPIGVVLPLDAEDAVATVAACREYRRGSPVARRRNQHPRPVLQRRRHPGFLEVHAPHRVD